MYNTQDKLFKICTQCARCNFLIYNIIRKVIFKKRWSMHENAPYSRRSLPKGENIDYKHVIR